MKWKVGDTTITKITEIIYPEFAEVIPAATPALSAVGLPPRGSSISRTSAPKSVSRGAGLSVDPSETTMICRLPAG